jgi:predicted ATPase
MGVPTSLTVLAALQWKAGRLEEAQASIEDALAVKEETGEAFYAAETYRIKGEVLLIDGHNSRDAEANFHEAIRIARQQGNRMFELRSAVSLARVWFEQGRVAEAHDLLVPIYSRLTEGFDSRDLLSASVVVVRLQNGAKV